MKTIDKYIIKKFLGTFFYSMFLMLGISMIIDITEKIDSFLENKIPLWEIITQYYIHFFPWIGLMLAPIFVFLSVIFFSSRLTANSEVVAMLTGRISFYRMLVPYLIGASLLCSLFLVFNHRWLPFSVGKKYAFENKYKINVTPNYENNIHFQVGKDTFVYVQNFNEDDTVAYHFAMEKLVNKNMEFKIKSERLKWDRVKANWVMEEWEERRQLQPGVDSIYTGKSKTINLPFGPGEFIKTPTYKETMTTHDLVAYIESEKQKGTGDLNFFYAEKYRRTAVPIGTIILTLIAVAMTTKKTRGGMGIYIVIGLALSGLYVLAQQFSTVFSTKGNLDPFIGSWIPNIIFGLVAVYLILRAPK